MPLVDLNASEWLALITHLKRWLGNLLRAGKARRHASRQALRAVIKAVRETTMYLRYRREGAPVSIEKERELSLLWTELSFTLQDLNLDKLAARCVFMGRYWADPGLFDPSLWDHAGQRLEDVEQLAMAGLGQQRPAPDTPRAPRRQ